MKFFVKGSIVDVVTDCDNTVRSIYFQTREMAAMFHAYPELLLIDATYKLNDLQMPLYVLMVVDGNGESEIVALWLTQCEDKVTLGSLINEFKNHNESWNSIQCIMSDKDMTERNVLTEHLPTAKLLICLFHTLRSMKREVSCEKLHISQAERTMSLEILNKMAYAKDEDEYTKLHDQLKQCAPKSVLEYFSSNWHDIRHQWVDGLKNCQCNFMNRTNNRVESINQKLKMVITRYSGITQFFHDLMNCLMSLAIERDHRAVEVTAKQQISNSSDPILHQYMELLTPYAFDFLKAQWILSQKVKFSGDVDEQICEFMSNNRKITTKLGDCSCGFVSAMRLPCCHVFSMRRRKGITEYDETLCAERWKLQYFTENHRVYNHKPNHSSLEADFPTVQVTKQSGSRTSVSRVYSEQEKYRKSFKVAQSLAQKLSCFGMHDFEEGMSVLTSIVNLWDEGKKVAVKEKIVYGEIAMIAASAMIVKMS